MGILKDIRGDCPTQFKNPNSGHTDGFLTMRIKTGSINFVRSFSTSNFFSWFQSVSSSTVFQPLQFHISGSGRSDQCPGFSYFVIVLSGKLGDLTITELTCHVEIINSFNSTLWNVTTKLTENSPLNTILLLSNLRTFSAITGYLNWGSLFCCSPLLFYRASWSTLDVPLVHIDFWLSRSDKCSWTWSSAQNLLYSLEQVLSVYSISSSVQFHADFSSYFWSPFDWMVTEAHCQKYGCCVHRF